MTKTCARAGGLLAQRRQPPLREDGSRATTFRLPEASSFHDGCSRPCCTPSSSSAVVGLVGTGGTGPAGRPRSCSCRRSTPRPAGRTPSSCARRRWPSHRTWYPPPPAGDGARATAAGAASRRRSPPRLREAPCIGTPIPASTLTPQVHRPARLEPQRQIAHRHLASSNAGLEQQLPLRVAVRRALRTRLAGAASRQATGAPTTPRRGCATPSRRRRRCLVRPRHLLRAAARSSSDSSSRGIRVGHHARAAATAAAALHRSSAAAAREREQHR